MTGDILMCQGQSGKFAPLKPGKCSIFQFRPPSPHKIRHFHPNKKLCSKISITSTIKLQSFSLLAGTYIVTRMPRKMNSQQWLKQKNGA